MANLKIYTPLGANPYVTTTDEQHGLGEVAKGEKKSEWVYAKATEALVVGQATLIDSNYNLIGANNALANTQAYGLGFPQVAFNKGDYGWVATGGSPIQVKTTASFAGKGAACKVNDGGVIGAAGQAVQGITMVSNTGSVSVAMPAIVWNPSITQ